MADVPPPPENPFLNETPDPYDNGSGAETLDQGRPNVAARPGRVLAVLSIVVLILLVLLYNIFSGEKKDAAPPPEKTRVAPPEPPPLPENPILTPPPPIAPPVIPPPTEIQIIKPEDDSAAKKQALERLHSKMLIAEGSPLSSVLPEEEEAPPPSGGDPNTAFEAKVVRATTKSEQVEATSIADLYRTIAQGRVIQATMESALNTDLPAPIRAIVSRDTYGEAGHEPLIPKGSRLIGTYNTDLTGGQSRVFVVWTRVIRPDGVDVQLGSPLVDVIGQAGIGGQVDSKFQETFARSLLSSVLSIAMAIGSDKLNRESGGSTDTTTTTDAGTPQTTGSAASMATVDALNRLGSTSDDFIQRLIDPRPTILIDQGTPVNVFVNRDLIFPSRYGHHTAVVE